MNPFKRLRSEDVVANAQAEYDSAPPLEPIPTHQATTRDYGSTNEPVIYGDFSTVSRSHQIAIRLAIPMMASIIM